jgi:hypothetical protein
MNLTEIFKEFLNVFENFEKCRKISLTENFKELLKVFENFEKCRKYLKFSKRIALWKFFNKK